MSFLLQYFSILVLKARMFMSVEAMIPMTEVLNGSINIMHQLELGKVA